MQPMGVVLAFSRTSSMLTKAPYLVRCEMEVMDDDMYTRRQHAG